MHEQWARWQSLFKACWFQIRFIFLNADLQRPAHNRIRNQNGRLRMTQVLHVAYLKESK
jgi:hypothetical protein